MSDIFCSAVNMIKIIWSIFKKRNTKEKRHLMTLKDKAKWFSFEMSFVLREKEENSLAIPHIRHIRNFNSEKC